MLDSTKHWSQWHDSLDSRLCQTFNHRAARVTLIDRQNHHLFQPLLYQVATAGLSAPEIARPIRSILSDQPNVTVLLDHVTGFDLAAKTVRLEENTLTYDYLVLALGGQTRYFGRPEWEQFDCLGMARANRLSRPQMPDSVLHVKYEYIHCSGGTKSARCDACTGAETLA